MFDRKTLPRFWHSCTYITHCIYEIPARIYWDNAKKINIFIFIYTKNVITNNDKNNLNN